MYIIYSVRVLRFGSNLTTTRRHYSSTHISIQLAEKRRSCTQFPQNPASSPLPICVCCMYGVWRIFVPSCVCVLCCLLGANMCGLFGCEICAPTLIISTQEEAPHTPQKGCVPFRRVFKNHSAFSMLCKIQPRNWCAKWYEKYLC